MILRYEPNYSKSRGQTYLDLAARLGSGKPVRMLKEGSDSFSQEDVHLHHELTECHASNTRVIVISLSPTCAAIWFAGLFWFTIIPPKFTIIGIFTIYRNAT